MSSLAEEELIMPTLNVLLPLLETKNAVFARDAKYFIDKFLDLCSHKSMVSKYNLIKIIKYKVN